MKTKYFLIITITAITMLFSCKKDETGPVLEVIKAPEITQPETGGTYVLTDNDANNSFAVFKWTKAEYNVPVVVSYALEADLKDNNFSNPVEIVVTNADSADITVFDFNVALTNELGLEAGTAYDISLRVGAFAGSSEKNYSNPIDMNVTPYQPPYTPDSLYIMSGGTILKSLALLDDQGNYEGYVYLTAGTNDIILKGNDASAREFGDTGGNGTLEEGGTPISVSADGHYRFKINMYDLTLDLAEYHWGIIGSAVDPYDWSADINMAYTGNDKWEISTDTIANPIITGEFKFRPNDAWNPLNYGDDGGDGIPDEYGANIPISAGNWKITLDLSEYPYSYTVSALK